LSTLRKKKNQKNALRKGKGKGPHCVREPEYVERNCLTGTSLVEGIGGHGGNPEKRRNGMKESGSTRRY